VRDKGVEAWDAVKKKSDDADAKARDYEQSVIDAKGKVIELGQQIGLSVPETKKLLLLIDDHQIDEVERQLNIMARNRTMNLSIIASGGQGYAPRNPSNGGGSNPTMVPLPPAPAGPGADLGPAALAAPDVVFPVSVSTAAAAPVTVDMRGAFLAGDRYALIRTVRVAVRDGVRLAGARNVLR
jgi:hypothetical protein